MLRPLLLWCSQSTRMKNFFMSFSAFRKTKERFVAGETLEECVAIVKKLNAQHIRTSVDYLGENVTTPEQAQQTKEIYLELLGRIAEGHLNSHVSVKLTALGLERDEQLCRKNLDEIVEKAQQTGSFVRIDMEGSPYTEQTLHAYRDARQKHYSVGAVLQAMLRRSRRDMFTLIDEHTANIRLCKGAYYEEPSIAYTKKNVDENYRIMAVSLLEAHWLRGVYPAFATHDEKIIDFIKVHALERNISPRDFEFQMLYGIREKLQQQLVQEGYSVRVYVPFGTDWYGYFLRRMAERPANLWFVVKNMLR